MGELECTNERNVKLRDHLRSWKSLDFQSMLVARKFRYMPQIIYVEFIRFTACDVTTMLIGKLFSKWYDFANSPKNLEKFGEIYPNMPEKTEFYFLTFLTIRLGPVYQR